MIRLKGLGLKNVAYFKNVEFQIPKGITFIHGLNLNARNKGASNGAGKSSLFAPLYYVLGFEIPVIKGRAAVRDVFAKGSAAYVDCIRGNYRWRFVKKPGSFRVLKNGVDLKVRTPTIAQAKVDKFFDLSVEEFYSYVFVDSGRPHPFQSGTSAQRFAFFTQVFRLDDMDRIRRWVKARINELRLDSRKLEDLSLERSNIEEELKDVSVSALTKDYQRLVDMQKSNSNRQQRCLFEIHAIDLWVREQKHREQARSLLKELGVQSVTDSEIDVILKDTKKQIGHMESLRVRWKRYEEYIQKRDDYISKRQRLVKELELESDITIKGLHSRIREADDALEALKITKEPKPIKKDKHAIAVIKASGIKMSLDGLQQARDKLSNTRNKLHTRLESALADYHSFQFQFSSNKECPTCHSTIDDKAKDSAARLLKQRVRDIEVQSTESDELLAALNSLLDYADYQIRAREYRRIENLARPFTSEKVRAMKKLEFVLSALQHLEAVEKPREQPPTSKEIEEQENRIRIVNELRALRRMHSDSEAYEKGQNILNGREPNVVTEELNLKLSELRKELDNINPRIPALRSRIDKLKELKSRCRDLEDKMSDLKSRLEDLPIYTALLDAYGPSGIKLFLVKKIALALERNLNRYAQSLFREDFRFSLSVEDGLFSAQVHRISSGVERVSDIRHLSGAERRVFSWLFLLALLPLIPNGRRFDTLILDEPTANLDADLINVFCERLLPQLNTVVPKIVVITPDSNLSLGKVYTVVKKGAFASLVEGSA